MTRHFDTYQELAAALALEPAQTGAFRFLKSYGPATFTCATCGQRKGLNTGGCGATGYARTADRDEFMCYPCAAAAIAADLVRDGRGMLYLANRGGALSLSDWAGERVYKVHRHTQGRHNIARVRYDVWFTGPDGKNWHGVQYGDNTQICHVRRLAK